YYHPNAGNWPDNLYSQVDTRKYIGTVSSTVSSLSWFAIWSGVHTEIGVAPDNSVTFTETNWYDYVIELGNSEEPGDEPCFYDPATRTFTLVYQYSGSGGYRHFYETMVYSPDQGK
ncbi:MAG: hypothetical protein V2I37_14275, partial [Marinilabiliaceae bacterium]|nr:hypothetical protein [Marinilabiliaceae bacterium]